MRPMECLVTSVFNLPKSLISQFQIANGLVEFILLPIVKFVTSLKGSTDRPIII